MTEFIGTNFCYPGYNSASYRTSQESIRMNGFTIPFKVEALRDYNFSFRQKELEKLPLYWERHPSVFVYLTDEEKSESLKATLVVFNEDGIWSNPYEPSVHRRFVDFANLVGLCDGTSHNVRIVDSFFYEEW